MCHSVVSVSRFLVFSVPLLFACTSSDPASAVVTQVPPSTEDAAGATDGSIDASAEPTSDASANDASPNDASSSDGSTADASSQCTTIAGSGGAALTPPPALVTAMNAASPGDVVSLSGMNESAAPTLAVTVCTAADAPTLLFSDSPEAPSADGILYADTVNAGRYRLYVYQVNGGNPQRKFPVVVFNPGNASATVKILRRGLAAPSTDYVAVGKSVLADWLAPKTLPDVVVAAGQRVVLDASLDGTAAQKDRLVHAIFDIETNAQL